MGQVKPWHKIGNPRELAKKFGKWLIAQDFENPSTAKIEEFILYGQRDWSIVLPVTQTGMVVTVHQYKQVCDSIIHELPAGTADFKEETPEDVMRRELLEETGYAPEIVIALGKGWIASRSSPTCAHLFLAFHCSKTQNAKIDASEEIETELVPLQKWIDLCVKAAITDWSSVVTTLRALPFLGFRIER